MNAQERQIDGDHYRQFSVQPWEAMEAWLTPNEFSGFLRGNAIKYLARAGKKGTALADIKKAHHYCERLIELLEEHSGDDAGR